MLTIYLADLTHTTTTLSNDTMPLGIDCVAAYLKTRIPEVKVYRFKYPEDLLRACESSRPDIADPLIDREARGLPGARGGVGVVFYTPQEQFMEVENYFERYGRSAQAFGKIMTRVWIQELQRRVRYET